MTFFTFQCFDDSKSKDFALQAVRHGSLDDCAEELVRLHARSAGVFYTVNETDGKGRKASNIVRVRAIWQDDDSGAGHPPAPFPPAHIELETSPGRFQRLWLVDGMTSDQHRIAMKAMARLFGSDPNATDLCRVLRVPGFYHQKREPFMVRMVGGLSYVTGAAVPPYHAEEILRALGCDDGETTTTNATFTLNSPQPIEQTIEHPADVKAADTFIDSLAMAYEGTRNATGYRVAAKLFGLQLFDETRWEMFTRWNDEKCSHPLDDDELTTLFRQGRVSRQNPIGSEGFEAAVSRFDVIEPLPPAATQPVRNLLEYPSDISLDAILKAQARSIVKGLIAAGDVGIIYGESTAGKSFVLLDLGYHVALGQKWAGLRVTQSAVLYVCLEGVAVDVNGDVRHATAATLRDHAQRTARPTAKR
ncbi:MAG: AAA family ATPase [Hyphomicrobium sp.]|nr:AAA family ATPase [Hyphomicrobium sp.]